MCPVLVFGLCFILVSKCPGNDRYDGDVDGNECPGIFRATSGKNMQPYESPGFNRKQSTWTCRRKPLCRLRKPSYNIYTGPMKPFMFLYLDLVWGSQIGIMKMGWDDNRTAFFPSTHLEHWTLARTLKSLDQLSETNFLEASFLQSGS